MRRPGTMHSPIAVISNLDKLVQPSYMLSGQSDRWQGLGNACHFEFANIDLIAALTNNAR